MTEDTYHTPSEELLDEILRNNLESQKTQEIRKDSINPLRIKKANENHYRRLPRYYEYDIKGNLKQKYYNRLSKRKGKKTGGNNHEVR